MGAVVLAVPRRPTPTVRRNPLKGKRLDERVVNPAARVSRRAATPVRAAPRVDPRRHRADPAGLAAALAGAGRASAPRLFARGAPGGHRRARAGRGSRCQGLRRRWRPSWRSSAAGSGSWGRPARSAARSCPRSGVACRPGRASSSAAACGEDRGEAPRGLPRRRVAGASPAMLAVAFLALGLPLGPEGGSRVDLLLVGGLSASRLPIWCGSFAWRRGARGSSAGRSPQRGRGELRVAGRAAGSLPRDRAPRARDRRARARAAQT